MLAKISHQLGESKVNIAHMANESRGDLAYTLIDVESQSVAALLDKISGIEGVLSVRSI